MTMLTANVHTTAYKGKQSLLGVHEVQSIKMIKHSDTRNEVHNTPYKCKERLQTATYNNIGYDKHTDVVNGTNNVVCLSQDSVLMMVALCYTKTLERQFSIG